MHISKHARIRCQQRGFRQDYLDIILTYGSPERKPGNVMEFKLSKKDRARIEGELKNLIQALHKLSKKAVIVSCATGEIITAYNLAH